MSDDRWLSVEELSHHLGVAKDSVYRWIRHKGFPAHKIGKLWKFRKHEVDEWVRQGHANNLVSEVDSGLQRNSGAEPVTATSVQMAHRK